MLLDRLKADSCLVISNLRICAIGHFKEQTVCFRRRANRNGFPHAGAKGKFTTIQTNTKARKGGGRYGGTLTAEPSCTVFGMRVCQRERRAEQNSGGGGTRVNPSLRLHTVCPFLPLPSLSLSHTHAPRTSWSPL